MFLGGDFDEFAATLGHLKTEMVVFHIDVLRACVEIVALCKVYRTVIVFIQCGRQIQQLIS